MVVPGGGRYGKQLAVACAADADDAASRALRPELVHRVQVGVVGPCLGHFAVANVEYVDRADFKLVSVPLGAGWCARR